MFVSTPFAERGVLGIVCKLPGLLDYLGSISISVRNAAFVRRVLLGRSRFLCHYSKGLGGGGCFGGEGVLLGLGY